MGQKVNTCYYIFLKFSNKSCEYEKEENKDDPFVVGLELIVSV